MKKNIIIAVIAVILTLICSFRIVANKRLIHRTDEDDIFGDWDPSDE